MHRVKHTLHTAWHDIADGIAADGRHASRFEPGADGRMETIRLHLLLNSKRFLI